MILALLAGALGCGDEAKSGAVSETMPEAVFETTLEVLDAGGNPAATFAPGQPITFKLTVRNRTNEPQSWSVPDRGRQHDFMVIGAGQTAPAWGGSLGVPITLALFTSRFSAQEVKVFETTWTQVDDSGNAVAAGIYDVQGYVATLEERIMTSNGDFTPTELRSSRVPFAIQ